MSAASEPGHSGGGDGEGGGGATTALRPPALHGEGEGRQHYVLALDVGTTVMRGHVYDGLGHVRGESSSKLPVDHPKRGWFEIEPHKLFEDAKSVMRDSIEAAGITADQVTCLGIATQRNTFVTWDRETGQPFHNLITWQDLRAADYVDQWNGSLTMKAINGGARLAHFFSRRKHHLAASVLKFNSKQVTMRLLWVLKNVPRVRERAREKQVMYGCIDTWLVWRLTGGRVHATDYSCASASGIFDPFSVEWSPIVTGLVDIPMSIFPEIRDTSGDFGSTDASIFGVSIPIRAVVADQQGAMFSQCCFNVGDVKCTLGTGMFLDVNTGNTPHASLAGLYPLVAWKIGDELTFIAEGHCADAGNVMEWGQRIGLFEDVSETSAMASSVEDSGGICFVPAFSGIQAPINDDKAATTFFGMTLTTTKCDMARAMLDSIAFRFKGLYQTVLDETTTPLGSVRVDGGVCSNDFLMQHMADVVDKPLERSAHYEMTSLGAAFLAGLASGVWQSKDELVAMRRSDKVFEPRATWDSIRDSYHLWHRAVARSLNWYRP